MNLIQSYKTLPSEFFEYTIPDKIPRPKLLIFNHRLAESIVLNDKTINNHDQLAEWLSGNKLLSTSTPVSQAYAGHQFTHLNILGDGRACLLGEVKNATSSLHYDLQLKGSGKTPYSRGGDGKATVSAMLREYLISEAMHYLKIPTTRSLSVTATGETIQRQTRENGAVLARIASSHIRVGTFIYANLLYHESNDIKYLQSLLNYTIQRHYPEIKRTNLSVSDQALKLLQTVTKKQAYLVSEWQRIGFVHGIMNTDNITVSGETIDYGPCAFMDRYDPNTVFSSIDTQGRYAYKNQMPIMCWNLARFAESLLPLIDKDLETAITKGSEIIHSFKNYYNDKWQVALCAKIGLDSSHSQLANELLSIMQEHQFDYTNTFRDLTLMLMQEYLEEYHDIYNKINNLNKKDTTLRNSIKPDNLIHWLKKWHQALPKGELGSQIKLMQSHNPIVIPRNHLVEKSLSEAKSGNLSPFHKMLSIIEQPYNWQYQNIIDSLEYQSPAPEEWQKNYQTFCGT